MTFKQIDMPIRITNTPTVDGISTTVYQGNKDISSETRTLDKTGEGGVNAVQRIVDLRFPENIGANEDEPLWIKYEIFDVIHGEISGTSLRPNVIKEPLGTIALSLPEEGLSVSSNQNWSSEAADAKSQVGMVLKNPKAAINNLDGNGFMEKGGAVLGGVADAVGQGVSGKFQSSLSTEAIVDKMALQYDGPEIRGFETSHSFVPRSASESARIKEIVNAFRRYSAPTKSGGGLGITYKLPKFFKVTYMVLDGPNMNLPQYNLCYCSSVSVKYPETSFVDNSPTSVDISLSFTELDPIDSDMIVRGY